MIKKMKYETPEIEITSFEIEKRIMGNADKPGDEIIFNGVSDNVGDSDDLFDAIAGGQ